MYDALNELVGVTRGAFCEFAGVLALGEIVRADRLPYAELEADDAEEEAQGHAVQEVGYGEQAALVRTRGERGNAMPKLAGEVAWVLSHYAVQHEMLLMITARS